MRVSASRLWMQWCMCITAAAMGLSSRRSNASARVTAVQSLQLAIRHFSLPLGDTAQQDQAAWQELHGQAHQHQCMVCLALRLAMVVMRL